MKKIFLTVVFALVSILSFGQDHFTDSVAVIYYKTMMDSCYAASQTKSKFSMDYVEYKDQYNYWKYKYNKAIKRLNIYNGISNQYTINDAGKYLKRSANCEVASLCFVGAGALSSTLIAIKSENPKIAYVTGGICGATALGFYIASIANKYKAGKIMENVQFTGNGFIYKF